MLFLFLNKKKGPLSLTSLLPFPSLRSTYQLAKNHRLPYSRNEYRSSHVLNLIHCDLWGPLPVTSNLDFLCYVIFIDDYSLFTWLYPLNFKFDFFDIFLQFQKLVGKSTFYSVSRFFKTMEVLNLLELASKLTYVLLTSTINSLVHTPAQNGCVERKYRHVAETGLVLLFHSHLSPRFFVDDFNTVVYIINRFPTPLLGGKSPFVLLYGYSSHYDNFHPLVMFILACVIRCITNFLPAAFLAFSWVKGPTSFLSSYLNFFGTASLPY